LLVGDVSHLGAEDRHRLYDRSTASDTAIRARVAELIARVRRDGDAALFALARELDHTVLTSLEVPRTVWTRALDTLDRTLVRAMERSRANIEQVHRAWAPQAVEIESEPGIVVGRRPDPLARVGVYAPGGRAAYPSSVLMGVVPARVAGVGEVVLCSPPAPEGVGHPSPSVLAAAALTSVDRVFAIGGAGAVAAMAYGTATVPRVDRIIGPGNAYVAEAKLQVSGVVAIDSPAGPSELLILGDATADPAFVARELLAQAEHDPHAAVVAVVVDTSPGRVVRSAVVRDLAAQLERQPRRDIIRQALATRGAVLAATSMDEAVAVANEYAAEHLLLVVREPDAVLGRLRNAGTIFIGASSSNAYGDYMTGANHVLPTGGLARSYSGLSTLDFIRWTTYQRVTSEAAARLAADVAVLADAEGLPGHAAAARKAGEGRSPADRDGRSEHGGGQVAPLVRATYSEIPLYAPETDGGGACPVDVSDNTNLWGVPPAAGRAIHELSAEAVTRYPMLYGRGLDQAFAHYLAVPPEMVVTGCGSDDVLDCAIRAFAAPGTTVALPDPSFSMIPTFARLNGVEPILVGMRETRGEEGGQHRAVGPPSSRRVPEALDIDPDRLIATGARIIYLCSPNNPTGTALSRAAVEYVVEQAPGLVVLDEAYAEFAGASCIDLLVRSERLLITRTMSKAFGLAGLRIGYGAGSPALAREVRKSRGPYKVNAVAERAALAALREDREWMLARVAEAVANRERLAAAIVAAGGYHVLPSAANFILVVPDESRLPPAPEIARRMRERGVGVRAFPYLTGIGGALRIGVGPWAVMERVLAALPVPAGEGSARVGGRGDPCA
jgi:histidinol dehydrogenase